ncbi:asparagine synthase-related protein [Tistrella mobilis]|uniref:asparagine synthase-related protein n=1 Tax=Tistrella mobilis TaxID=171437 RepID=UPI0035585F96
MASAGQVAASGRGLPALHGRIDDPARLRDKVGARATVADSTADLVQALLERLGPEGLARCQGIFSLAFWDDAGGRLLLTADPLGRRTVFYTRIDGLLVFSSCQRILLGLPGVSRALNDGFLAALLSDVVPETDATLYAAIRRVPAACTLAFGPDGDPVVREYWRPDLVPRRRHRRDETYVEEARALLDQAVTRQLPGSGPVVCELSGGLDSGAVAATAARLRPQATIHALTLAPPDGVARFEAPSVISDERPGAAAVAAIYPNMAWEAVSSPALHPIDENPVRIFLAMAGPARNVLNLGWFGMSMDRARALGARAVLNGSFGNMTLSWNGLSGLATMARRGDWLRLWREAAALGRRHGLSAATVIMRYGLKPLLPPRLQCRLNDRRGLPRPASERHSAIHPDFARATRIAERRLDTGHDYPGDTATMRRQWLSRIQTMQPWFDPMIELFGVEMRDPMADLDLLEFCFATPDDQYLRAGRTRWLARRVLADRLPPQVIDETRRGFQCPEFLHRMTLQREAIVEGVATLERSPLASRVLDIARMKRLAADWPRDAASTGFGDYGGMLNRGLHFGRFLRWIEGGNG